MAGIKNVAIVGIGALGMMYGEHIMASGKAKLSLRQDGLAKRKSEVDLFAGTIVALGKKHNIPTPVNNIYYNKIKAIEKNY